MSAESETQKSMPQEKHVPTEVKDKVQDQQPKSDEDKQQAEHDRKLAQQIADIIASALDRVKPITNMIQQVYCYSLFVNLTAPRPCGGGQAP
jgi:hypothetical protein